MKIEKSTNKAPLYQANSLVRGAAVMNMDGSGPGIIVSSGKGDGENTVVYLSDGARTASAATDKIWRLIEAKVVIEE